MTRRSVILLLAAATLTYEVSDSRASSPIQSLNSHPRCSVELPTDNWIRIHVDAGNLIVLPAGIYHRFSLDSSEYIKTMRLFKVCVADYDEPLGGC